MPVKNVKNVEIPAILSELYKGNQSKAVTLPCSADYCPWILYPHFLRAEKLKKGPMRFGPLHEERREVLFA